MENVNIYKIRYKIRSIWEIKGTKEAGENTLKNFKSQKSFILIIAHEYKNRDFHLLVLFSQRIFTPGCPLSPKTQNLSIVKWRKPTIIKNWRIKAE